MKKRKSVEIPKIFVIVGQILQFISNKLASKYALWLFFKPLRFRMPQREEKMDQESQQYSLEVPSIGKEINVYRYKSGEKRLLLVHGWSGRGTQLVTMADFFAEKGYEIISFDAPAHGKSKGNKTYMKEFVMSILEIGKHYQFDAIIGHSLGAMSVINAVRLGFQTNKIVAIAGGDLVTDIIDDFTQKMGFNQKVWQRIHDYLNEILKESINEFSVSVAVKKIDQPILIIHDTDDIDVDVKCAYNIHKNAKNAELLITNGLGHRKILADESVIKKIDSFLM